MKNFLLKLNKNIKQELEIPLELK